MTAAAIRQQALARKAAGDNAGAARLFAEGLAAFPNDAGFANSAGNFHAGAGRPAEALAMFERALALMPALHEAAVNRAVVLTRLGRAEEAAALLVADANTLAAIPRYWTTRGAAELAMGAPGKAAISYEAALRREPANLRALHGRAQAALEGGEARAVADYERALANSPGDPSLRLNHAYALWSAGRPREALEIARSLTGQTPYWTDAFELRANLRWALGDGDRFADHYAAAARGSAAPALYQSWAAMLSGLDRHLEAADVLLEARSRWPDAAGFAWAEAVAAGLAGADDRARALYAHFARPEATWQIAEARHRLQTRDPAAAERLLASALTAEPMSVQAWSLRDLAWRLTDDPRHVWLHGQPGLVRSLDLGLGTRELADLRSTLDRLHENSAMPVGQSVKNGTQTRGALFMRSEAAIVRVTEAIREALERYRAGLPPSDPTHPLLRYRERPWRITGSWSIRLDGAGHHAAHIHPAGVLSSAAYIVVPDQVDEPDGPGQLELGRPPAELKIDLPPLMTIIPREGECALFPSTLFHGTRPISSGRRMTVAFDVAEVSTSK